MKNEKTKPKQDDQPVYSISVQLQAGRTAEFTYNDFQLADAHYTQLQAQPFIGQLGIKSVQRSWRK